MARTDMIVKRGKVGIGQQDQLSTLTVTAPSAFTLTGTVAKTASSDTLVGTGTAFLDEVGIGDRLEVPGGDNEVRFVVAVSSDTSLQVELPFINTASGEAATCHPSIARFEDGGGEVRLILSDEGVLMLGLPPPLECKSTLPTTSSDSVQSSPAVAMLVSQTSLKSATIPSSSGTACDTRA